jgi:hypothetical protein
MYAEDQGAYLADVEGPAPAQMELMRVRMLLLQWARERR